MSELVVGTVASPQPWRRALHAHVRDHATGIRLVVLHEADDVARGRVDVVVVDDTLEVFSSTQAAALREGGVRLVGLFDPTGRAGRGRKVLDRLGVDSVVVSSISPEALVYELALRSPTRPAWEGLDGAVTGLGAEARLDDRPGTAGGDGRGTIVVVSGGSGAPGRTEVAAALAETMAGQGRQPLLVDLDERDPSVARRLGLELVPNVLDALAARREAGVGREVLARRAGFAGRALGFDAIAGLAQPGDWAQLVDVGGLVRDLSALWGHVVVDTGPSAGVEESEGRARCASTRAALNAADHVIAVCAATPLGLLRLCDWATDAAELIEALPVTVAVNQAPRDGYKRAELAGQVRANLPNDMVGEVVFLPWDRGVGDTGWDGQPVTGGRFAKAVEALGSVVAPVPAEGRAVRARVGWGRRA